MCKQFTASDIMTEDHKARLRLERAKIVDNINLPGVLNEFLVANVLTQRNVSSIRAGATRYEQAEEFLDILDGKPDSCFEIVKEILSQKQAHIANLMSNP